MAERTYHHGDLRRALLLAAATAIEESGPAGLSLRDLARRAGVSHAAPTHHFGDKAGLLTALAAEGFDMFARDLAATRAATGSFLEMGVTYVRFAVTHRAHFEVMFRPDLYHADDPELAAARQRASDALYAGVADLPDRPTAPSGAESAARPEPSPAAGPATGSGSAGAAAAAAESGSGSGARSGPPPGGTTAGSRDVREVGLAAWSMAHGFATLWLSGALPDMGTGPDDAARAILRRLNRDPR